MSLKGVHKALEREFGSLNDMGMEAVNVLLELFCIASAAFGPLAVLELVFGRSEIVSWIGAALGCVAALFVWMAFSSASSAEKRIEELETELKALKEDRN